MANSRPKLANSSHAGKPIMLCVINTKQNTRSPEFLVEKEYSPLENDPGHGNAQIGVFRHQGTFWAEYFVCLCYMGLIIFQTPYPEKKSTTLVPMSAHGGPMGAHKGRRQSSGRETWAKFKFHQIRSNGTVPSPPNQFFHILFFVYNSRSTTYGGSYVISDIRHQTLLHFYAVLDSQNNL